MVLQNWFNWVLSCIVTSYNWLLSVNVFGVPLIYILVGIFVMGVVIRAIPFRA